MCEKERSNCPRCFGGRASKDSMLPLLRIHIHHKYGLGCAQKDLCKKIRKVNGAETPFKPLHDYQVRKMLRNLRQWTSYRIKERYDNNTFTCEIHPKMKDSGSKTLNIDNNRFNCFACDYDVCGQCVTLTCYLCCEDISIINWDAHRKICAKEYAMLMEQKHPLSPSMTTKRGKCSGYLRQWTSYRIKERSDNNTFICDIHPKLKDSGFKTLNIDNNRFNCFACDYDVCSQCARKISSVYRIKLKLSKIHQWYNKITIILKKFCC